MKDPISRNRNAVNKSFNRWHGVLGIETDSDLDLYKSLTEEDFKRISQKYGQPETISYIQEMESRMMKQGGKNG